MEAKDIVIEAENGGAAFAFASEAQRAIGARAHGYGGGSSPRAFVLVRASSGGGAVDAFVHPRSTSASAALAHALMRKLSATSCHPRGVAYGEAESISPVRVGAGTAACVLGIDPRLQPSTIGPAIARGLQSYVGALERLERRVRLRFGDPSTEPMSCSGWEGDCQSMAKKVSDRMFYNHLRRDQSIRADRIVCHSATHASVIYTNGEQIEVSWAPATQRASATRFQNPPPGDRGIITHWCDYSYSCTADGTLHLANDDCWG